MALAWRAWRWQVVGLLALVVIEAKSLAAPNAPTQLTAFMTKTAPTTEHPNTYAWLWTDNATDETGFEIRYWVGPGAPAVLPHFLTTVAPTDPVSATGGTGAVFNLQNLPSGQNQITFQVFSYIGTSTKTYSAGSNKFTVTIPTTTTFARPTNVKATAQSESVLRLTWTDVSNSEIGMEVWQSIEGQAYTDLGDIYFYQGTSTDIGGRLPGLAYRYKLRPFREDENDNRTYPSPDFSVESAPAYTHVPDAPTNLRVVEYGSDYVHLKFQDNSWGDSHFDIMSRPVGGGPFVIRRYYSDEDNPEGTDLTVELTGLTPGIAHEFIVRARAQWGPTPVFSAMSNVAAQVMRDAITSSSYAQGYVNRPFSYTLTTTTNTGAPAGRNITNLPPGLSFDSVTGVVSGTPTATGVTQASTSVTFQDGWNETEILAFRILDPPVVGTALPSHNLVTGTPSPPVALADKFVDPAASSAVRLNTTLGNIDLVMFDADTPLTVANFHNYRNAGQYTDNVFHRNVPGFIIQAGGYRLGEDGLNHFLEVVKGPQLQNEFQHSNIRGTVAMAKMAPPPEGPPEGGPNSATSEWFINLDNNGPNLDVQNGGFTAFARVAGNGMSVADAIARKPVNDYFVFFDSDTQASLLRDFPLNAAEPPVLMDNTKAMKINNVMPVGLFSYAVTGNTHPGVATAAIVNGEVIVTPVDSGTTDITVTATNLDGATVSQTFQASVISNVPTLSNLAPSSGALSPAFASGTKNYTVAVPNSVSSLSLTPTSTNHMASITVEGAPVASGTGSTFFPLPVGDTVLDVNITAEDGVTTEHYTVTVKRSAVELASTFIVVNEEAGFVNIPLMRSGDATNPVTIQISTNNGTASAPADFTAKTNEEVTLGANETSLNVPVTLANPANTSEPNETFTVTISNVGAGTALAAPETVTVLIIDTVDTANPVVTVTSPVEGVVLSQNSGIPVTISGTATDNRGIKQVQMSVNGGAFNDISFSPPASTSPTSATFNVPITPVSGTNTVTVKCLDYRNRVSNTVVRTFKVLRPLSVALDSSRGSVTAGYAGNTYREVGKSFTITATPKPATTNPVFPGAIFTGWTIGGQDVVNGNVPFTHARLGIVASALEKQMLTFIFREGLTLTANFALNPFAPMAGSYNGLIRPSDTLPDRLPAGPGGDDGTLRTNATEGRFSATVQNTGAFSGTLTIDGLALSVNGAFDQNGNARFGTARLLTQTVARANKPSLVVALQLDMNTPGAFDKITGTVTATDFKQSVIAGVSTVEADRAYYNGTTLIPADYLAPGNANGMFTTIFPAEPLATQTPGYAVEDYPQGRGVATVIITKAGVVTVTGTLADGNTISATSALSQSKNFPLFAQMYNKLGFVSGFVQLDNTQADSDLAAQDLQWLRPFQGMVQHYPFGWTDPIKLDMLGAKYVVTAGQSVLKAANGAGLAAANTDGNVALSFTDGLLTETLHRAANISTGDVVTKAPDNDPTFTLTINRTTGAVTGLFDHTDDTKPAYNAIVIQKGPNAGAYGYFLTKQPPVIDYTGESGGVSVTGQ